MVTYTSAATRARICVQINDLIVHSGHTKFKIVADDIAQYQFVTTTIVNAPLDAATSIHFVTRMLKCWSDQVRVDEWNPFLRDLALINNDLFKWLVTVRHNQPTEPPITASTGINAGMVTGEHDAAAPAAQSKARSSVVVTAARGRLSSRERSRSASVDAAREKFPLLTPTASTVRASMAADMRDVTLGVGITSESQAYLIGRDRKEYDAKASLQEELLAILPNMPVILITDWDWSWYKKQTNCSVCFKYIPHMLTEDVFLERLFTCDGLVDFGHTGIIAVGVKHTESNSVTHKQDPDCHNFDGMVYVTFASEDLACYFNSYWRGREMYFSSEVKDDNGNVTRNADYRFVESGEGSIVGNQRYSNIGVPTRVWARFGADVWAFWPPCRNQNVTRARVGLPPLPAEFEYNGRNIRVIARDP